MTPKSARFTFSSHPMEPGYREWYSIELSITADGMAPTTVNAFLRPTPETLPVSSWRELDELGLKVALENTLPPNLD